MSVVRYVCCETEMIDKVGPVGDVSPVVSMKSGVGDRHLVDIAVGDDHCGSHCDYGRGSADGPADVDLRVEVDTV